MPRQSVFDKQALVLLESAQLDHGNHPTKEVTKELAEVTGLPRQKVWDWFNTQRQAALPLNQRKPAMARRAREAKKAAMEREIEGDEEESEEEESVGEVESGGESDEEDDETEEDNSDVITWSEDETAATAGAKRKKGPVSKAIPRKMARVEVGDEAEDEEVEKESEEME